jgi:hypothetical protein
LRSLEEFRKNPHVKIPPKSPSTNFQSLGKFKNQFLIRKFFSLLSARPTPRPVRPLAQPAHRPRRPRRPKSSWPAHPARASVVSSRKICFPFQITPSRAGCLSLVALSTRPHLSDSPPSPRRPTPVGNPRCRRSLAPLPAPRMPPSFYSTPSSISPLHPLQTKPLRALTPSMALKPLTPVINSRPPLPGAPPAPIKGQGPPPAITTPHLALNHSLPSPQLLLTERRRLPVLHHGRPASTAPPELW